MFCKECGRQIGTHRICPYCRNLQSATNSFYPSSSDEKTLLERGNRSYVTAGFLQIFLGAFGIGRFYLGFKKIACIQIIVTLVSFGVGGFLWGIIDGIMLLSGREKLDAKGKLMI